MKERKTHWCCTTCAARDKLLIVKDDSEIERLCGDVGDPAAVLATQNTKITKNRSGQVPESRQKTHLYQPLYWPLS